MKIALLGSNKIQFSKVYTPEVLEKLGEYGELSDRIEITIVSSNGTSSTSKPTTTKQYAVAFFEKHNVPTWQAYGQAGAVKEDFEEWFDEQCESIDTDEKSINNIETTIQTIVSLYSGY